MEALFGEWILDLRYYSCTETELEGIPLVVSRTGWTGEVGYELYLRDGSRGDELWERVMEAGKPFAIRPIAPSEARRIEAGIFNFGSDITMENTPFEVTGFERLVEPQQADYIGKDALMRIAAEGVQRKLVGVDIGGEPMTAEGSLPDFWPVLGDGEEIGRLTAGTWSPRLERNIGYAWVPIVLAEAGTRLEAASPAGPVPLTVAALPFVDPSKEIPRS